MQGGGAAACVTVTVCPASVMIAVRNAPVFAPMVSVTLPDPVPLVGEGTTQAESLIAVHAQLVRFAVTVTLLLAPPYPAETAVVESV